MEDTDLDIFIDEDASCPCCGGEGQYLGSLGALNHLRCRDCGTTFSTSEDED